MVGEGKEFGRVIVVDDDPDILLSARLLLRELFDEVAPFEDPEKALAAIGSSAASGMASAMATNTAAPT